MEVYKFKDTITFIKGNDEPIYGNIVFSTDPTPDDIVLIKSPSDTIRVPLKQIAISIFKVSLSQYGFIFKESLYSDNDVDFWDKQLELIARRKLKANFEVKYLSLRWQRKTKSYTNNVNWIKERTS